MARQVHRQVHHPSVFSSSRKSEWDEGLSENFQVVSEQDHGETLKVLVFDLLAVIQIERLCKQPNSIMII